MMLAYVAQYKEGEWCILVHGETRGKAKSQFVHCDPSSDYERSLWTEIRLRRLPRQDDKPFTYENAASAGFHYFDDWDGEALPREEFTNYCDCKICTRRS